MILALLQEATDAVSPDAISDPEPLFSVAQSATQAASSQTMSIVTDVGVKTIYLMGFSFILGCLFTVFILLVLDFMRRNAPPSN